MDNTLPYGKDLAKYKIDRAKEELDNAQLLFENERLKAANNRAYYSIYYSLTAVLCMEPVAFKKHKDTLAYFNKNYVHGGKFPSEIGRAVEKAAKIRHASDYDEFYIAGRDEALRQIGTAKKLIELVEEYIQNIDD